MSNNAQAPQTEEQLIGIDEAAAFLGLKRSTLYAHTSSRSVPHYKRGGRLYFCRSELLAWLKEGRRDVIQQRDAHVHLHSLRGGRS